MIFQVGLEVHAEDGGRARAEGEAEHAHLDVQAHADDPVHGDEDMEVKWLSAKAYLDK